MGQWISVGMCRWPERPRHGVAGEAADRRPDRRRAGWRRTSGRDRDPRAAGGAARMSRETKLWLIRHAPVDGPRGVIHGPDAPADISDAQAFAVLKAKLPPVARAVCSPARRTVETARTLGLDPLEEPAFREQDFGEWTGRRH